MPPMVRFSFLSIVLALVLSAGADRAVAQFPNDEDKPALHVPLREPTQKEIDELGALRLFAEGALCEREDKLMEAMRCYEEAAKLDPSAPTIQTALVAVYIAVERHEEAITAIKKVLELQPHNAEMSYLYGRLLRNQGNLEEAEAVLKNGLKSKIMADRPDLRHQLDYDLGIVCERMEHYEDAAAAFERSAAVFDRPDGFLLTRFSPEEMQMRAAEEHEAAGRNWLEAGKFEQAVAAFRDAQAKYPPGAGRLNYNLAQIGLRQGKVQEALGYLHDYLQTMPQGTEGYELMIGLLCKQKREAEILPWLEQASARDQFNVGLRSLLAHQLERAGETTKAEKVYRELAESSPTPQVYRDLFLLYLKNNPGGSQKIAQLIDSALDCAARKDTSAESNSAPTQVRALIAAFRENDEIARPVVKAAADNLEKTPPHIDALQIFAAVADRLEMLPEAETLYRLCIKDPLPPATEPLIYGGMLRVLWKARHYEAVVETCRTGLKLTQVSNRVLLRADLARALGQLSRWEEALSEADQAVLEAGDGERFTVRLTHVRLMVQAEKLAAAESECRALLKEFSLPGEALEVHYLLSGLFSAANRGDEAEAELVECLKIDADNPTVNNDLGYLWADRNKNLVEAEAMIRKALALDRKSRDSFVAFAPGGAKEFHDNACYVDSLGWVLYRRGKLAEAAQELQRAGALPDGDDPVIWDHLGEVYSAQGLKKEALAAWRKAMDFYAGNKRHNIEERVRVLRDKMKRLEAR
jgi:tetratricopeptide (TPR) repeat protein